MAEQLQFRRGTTADNASFTGAVGEVTYDTQKKLLITHDGSTAGGFPIGGFVQSGTGSVIRSVESKLKEFVSVKDFGAVGDGVANDTVAIQAALDSGAGTVFFPFGTYKITSSLSVSISDSISIIGEGSKIDVGSIVLDVLKVTISSSIDSVTIKGLHIDGNYVASYGIFVEGDAGACKRVTIENNIVENLNNTTTVTSCIGIRVDSRYVEATRIAGNTVKNINRTQVNPSIIASVGIGVYSIVHGVVVSGNHIEDVSSPAGDADADGVQVFSYNRLDSTHQTACPVVTENYFYNVKGRFIKSQSANTLVSSNRFEINGYGVLNNFTFVDLQYGGGIVSNNSAYWNPNSGEGTSAIFCLCTLRETATVENQYVISNNNLVLRGDLLNFVYQWVPESQTNPTNGTVKISDNVISSELDSTYSLSHLLFATVDENTSFLDLVASNNQMNYLEVGALLRFKDSSLDPMSDPVTGPAIADTLRITLTNNSVKNSYSSTDLIEWETGAGGYPYLQHLMISGNTNIARSDIRCQGMDVLNLPEGTSFYYTTDGATGGLLNAPSGGGYDFDTYVIVERPGENWVRLSRYAGNGVALFRTDTSAGYVYTSTTALTF